MRWFHESVDRLHVSVVSRVMPPVFRHGHTSLPLAEHLAAVHLELPPLGGSRRYQTMAETLVGPLEVGYYVRLGPRPELPVLVYHHGIAEMPYDRNFRGIFRGRQPTEAHLIAVRAPFHRSWLTVSEGLATLSQYVAMCAVSVKLMEAVRGLLVNYGARGSMMAGMSLGGFVALLHHLLVGTADVYAPLLAGPDLAHVMLSTHFRRFVAPNALEQAAHIQSLFDCRHAFQASATHRIFPVLAEYDITMPYPYHQACYAASNVAVVTLNRGHLTGALAFGVLRRHLLSCLAPLIHVAAT